MACRIDNKIDGVVITFVEVTERRNAEEALRQSEERLRQQRLLVEMSREPIFVWDFDAGIVEIEPWQRATLWIQSRRGAGSEQKHPAPDVRSRVIVRRVQARATRQGQLEW